MKHAKDNKVVELLHEESFSRYPVPRYFFADNGQ